MGAGVAEVLRHYFPDWDAPPDVGEWNACLCPFHGEANPSASVSYRHEAFVCHGCGMRGNVINLIKRKEDISFAEAVRRAEDILGESHVDLRRSAFRKRRRRAFGEPRSAGRVGR